MTQAEIATTSATIANAVAAALRELPISAGDTTVTAALLEVSTEIVTNDVSIAQAHEIFLTELSDDSRSPYGKKFTDLTDNQRAVITAFHATSVALTGELV